MEKILVLVFALLIIPNLAGCLYLYLTIEKIRKEKRIMKAILSRPSRSQ